MKIKICPKYVLLMCCIILSIVDFMGMGIYIMSGGIVLAIILVPDIVKKCLSSKDFLKFAILCLMVTILYCFSTWSFNRNFIAGTLLCPISMYVCGYSISEMRARYERGIINIILIIVVACTIYGFFTSINKGDINAYINYTADYQTLMKRNSYNIWNGQLIYGTVLSVVLMPSMALAYYSIVVLKGKYKPILVGCVIMGVYSSMMLASRSNIAIFVMSITVSLIILIIKKQKKSNKIWKRTLIVMAIVSIILAFNIGGAMDYILSSTFFKRMTLMSEEGTSLFATDDRMNIFYKYITSIVNNPLGGISIEGGFSAHNTIMQYGALGGIIGLVLSLNYFVPLFIRIIKLAWKDCTDKIYFSIPLTIAILMLFLVESVNASNAMMFSILNMFLVMIYKSYSNKNVKTEICKDICINKKCGDVN